MEPITDISLSVPGKMIVRAGERALEWELPRFPLSGAYTSPGLPASDSAAQDGDSFARTAVYRLTEDVSLVLELRWKAASPFLRFRYSLDGKGAFSTTDREAPIEYGAIRPGARALTEVQLSNFDRVNHTFKPVIERYKDGEQWGRSLIGPIVVAQCGGVSCLLAYEHGAEAPDHFLAFQSERDALSIMSCKGNYYRGQSYAQYISPWFELGIGGGEEELRAAYRRFVLTDMCAFPQTRTPKIYYNTWNNQERDKYFHNKPFLSAMRQEHMLREIDIAHELGVEVFVIDTGWYQKTGDWEVNLERFPDGLKAIREKLEGYGMEMGLWFNPIVAAQTSRPRREHPEWTMARDGKENYWGKIWETEESYGMCLVSDYADYFIEQLVRLHETLGVSYFKWDAVGQYGCDCPGHRHGGAANSPQERMDAYAYRMGLEMIRIAEEVTRRCPGATVDFDITEGGRFVGLGFLSAGKYFLINNGPYFSSFDIPKDVRMEPDTINVFFYPGAARPQVCRAFTQFDPWIPSTLFLTHFLPEGSEAARRNSMASLALGGNGVWGDLLHLSAEEIASWKSFLELYRQVREDAMHADPVTRGWAGASPEIHEKIDPETGRGLVCFFCRGASRYTYITRAKNAGPRVIGADEYAVREDGRLEIAVSLDANDARVVFIL